MTLGYVKNPKHPRDRRITWRMVLGWIIKNRESVTSVDISSKFGIPLAEASKRLKRLSDWGMVVRKTDKDKRRLTKIPYEYVVTDYGKETNRSPAEATGSTNEEAPFSGVSDLDALGGLTEGPVALMRIPAVKSAEEVTARVDEDDLVAEEKEDGWLVQMVSGSIYSRRGEDLSGKIPFITKAYRKQLPGTHHILAELIFVQDGTQIQSVVTAVCGTKNNKEAAMKAAAAESTGGHFELVLFDVLAGERDISHRPFHERRDTLEGLDISGRLSISHQVPFEDWEEAYETSLASGGEGVVFKNTQAPFPWLPLPAREPKPQGIMWKLKKKETDDFIVYDAFRADGGKLVLRFGQLHKGRIVEVGRVSNLSKDDEEEAEEKASHGPFVIEVTYQERTSRRPGKLRSPQFVRFRPDKPIESVTLPKDYA